jgi:hypothetical protein
VDWRITTIRWSKWREGKSSPYTGKLSARPEPVSPGEFLRQREFATIPSPPLAASKHTERSVRVFKAWRNLSLRCGQTKTKSWGGTNRLPLVGPVTQAKERVGRTTLFSSSAMSSGRLFLDRVARQHCPSPLHRHTQINMHSSDTHAKGDVSTLPAWGHFYFALTNKNLPLTTVIIRCTLYQIVGTPTVWSVERH